MSLFTPESEKWTMLGKRLRQQLPALSRSATELRLRLYPDLSPDTRPTYAACYADMDRHLSYLAESMAAGGLALFFNYLEWLKSLARSGRVSERDTILTLECLHLAVEQRFDHESLCAALQEAVTRFSHIDGRMLLRTEDADALDVQAKLYTAALIDHRARDAEAIVQDAVSQGQSIVDIFMTILQPALRTVGELWMSGSLDVAQEHFCTEATRGIMARLKMADRRQIMREQRILAACMPGEKHEIGLRMVADLLELDGWNVLYLGADMPSEDLLKAVRGWEPDVLALSATLAPHLAELSDIVGSVRDMGLRKTPFILVGGHPFKVEPGLWRRIGADASAADARGAVEVMRGYAMAEISLD